MPTNRTQPDPLILCVSCRYDLTGLNERGVCPECSSPIAQSVAASHHPVAPPWLRLLAISYFTSVTVLGIVAISPHFLPWATVRSWPDLWELSQRAGLCLIFLWFFGWLVLFACDTRSRTLTTWVAVIQTLIFVVGFLTPARGH